MRRSYICVTKTIVLAFLLCYFIPVSANNDQNFLKRLVDKQLKTGSNIGNGISGLLNHYPDQTEAVIHHALNEYPQHYKEIIHSAITSQPPLSELIVESAILSNVASPEDIVAAAIASEPAYTDLIVQTALALKPTKKDTILAIAVDFDRACGIDAIETSIRNGHTEIHSIEFGLFLKKNPDYSMDLFQRLGWLYRNNSELLSVFLKHMHSEEEVALAIQHARKMGIEKERILNGIPKEMRLLAGIQKEIEQY